MKKTRRFISAVMALAMVSVLAPMSAFADTVVDDTNNPAPKTAGFDVKYTYTNPAPTYTVTIPAGVTLSDSESVKKSIKAENVKNMEENGKKIVVTLNAATNDNDTDTTFHAKNGESDATYTITAGTTAVKVGDTVAEFTDDGSVELAFSKITLPAKPVAGDYTETLTFGISVEEVKVETLLTTITGAGSNARIATSANVTYSTEGIATLTFSGTVSYQASPAWGWWGYGWTATVTPAEGYTITKCVFYDDANRTATDSEAPFVVETTEEDKTPRINSTPIDGGKSQSKGLKKIEVYGYAN